MRSRILSLWLMLLVALAAQAAAYSLAVSLADYSRRAVYANFSAGAAAMREINGLPYADKINQAGRTYGINPEVIASVIKAESSFQPRALSKAGAYGLMQVIPGTWRLVNSQAKICSGRHEGECGSECFYDPDLNIAVGSYYLSQLVKRYSGRAELAVAAYNAGPGAVDKYGGIPPYAETTEYVERVVSNWYGVSGRWPPGGLAAESWTKIASALGWGIVMTAVAVAAVGRQLFRRYRSLRWR
ncbi:lytic transglycosylase domain-containing protein [Sporomusa sp.]|uniref:lytic transglycosylase domain-containing protein n=1 Tax=Sporomusa sp. TaxID=2078658 RepID=UPI002CA6389B|nr:lytic transglycosylase domain-containing protein [Sporomusa sp.]HWR43500.1 lytic transglycosylase domain-containing protein [Sporomusa sp.]